MDISGSRVLVIGGAGLVGSHLVDQLIEEDVEEIIIFDNFVRGTRRNLAEAVKSPKVKIVEGSITDLDQLRQVLRSQGPNRKRNFDFMSLASVAHERDPCASQGRVAGAETHDVFRFRG